MKREKVARNIKIFQNNGKITIFDGLVESQKAAFSAIPAKAGIQSFQDVLDPGFRRGDDPRDFLRDHHISWSLEKPTIPLGKKGSQDEVNNLTIKIYRFLMPISGNSPIRPGVDFR